MENSAVNQNPSHLCQHKSHLGKCVPRNYGSANICKNVRTQISALYLDIHKKFYQYNYVPVKVCAPRNSYCTDKVHRYGGMVCLCFENLQSVVVLFFASALNVC